jgi:tripartite-type tricarboxylate transporter receptor subunit TctC
MDRRTLIKGLAAGTFAPAIRTAHAQAWPSRPIRLIDAFATGSASDTILRTIAPAIQAALGQPAVVENRPGASGNIGAQACVSAPPDGHTFLMATNTMLTANPHLFTAGRVDPFKDLTFVQPVATMGMVMVVKADAPWRSLSDVIAGAKKQPGKLSYGTPGVGSPMHFIGEVVKQRTDTDLLHLPYKGGMPMVTDVLAGEVSVGIVAYAVVAGLIQQGRLRAIATAGSRRLAALPDVPAIGETIPDADLGAWAAIVAPAGLPADIRDRMAREIDTALRRPDVVERLRPLGLDQIQGNAQTIADLVRPEYARVGELIRRLDIKLS